MRTRSIDSVIDTLELLAEYLEIKSKQELERSNPDILQAFEFLMSSYRVNDMAKSIQTLQDQGMCTDFADTYFPDEKESPDESDTHA